MDCFSANTTYLCIQPCVCVGQKQCDWYYAMSLCECGCPLYFILRQNDSAASHKKDSRLTLHACVQHNHHINTHISVWLCLNGSCQGTQLRVLGCSKNMLFNFCLGGVNTRSIELPHSAQDCRWIPAVFLSAIITEEYCLPISLSVLYVQCVMIFLRYTVNADLKKKIKNFSLSHPHFAHVYARGKTKHYHEFIIYFCILWRNYEPYLPALNSAHHNASMLRAECCCYTVANCSERCC